MENPENDMPFMKFPKIYENMAEFKFPKKIEWIATEKIDGSNFSVYSNGAIVKFAKRTGFLNNIEDWFFNYQLISLELSKQANQIYQIIKQKDPKIKFIIVYGELNGGFYPEDHKNWTGPVPSRINAKGIITIPLEKRAIQEGVYYNNKISLIVFDIGIVNAEGILNYLEYDEMVNMCKNVNLPYTHLLIKGNIQKMLDYSLEFNSTIPALFGLPPLEYNKAEGIVIRPVIWNGPGDERPMLKRKNKKFKQFSGDFDINQVKKNPILSANCMMNQNRLNGVVSKTGPLVEKQVIIEELVEDIWSSLWEMNVVVTNYDEVDNYIKKQASYLVNEYLITL